MGPCRRFLLLKDKSVVVKKEDEGNFRKEGNV